MWSAPSVLIHGDLRYENLLVDAATGELTGVLDWEEALAGDAAQDMATLMYVGEPFVWAVIGAYQRWGGRTDAQFARRVAGYWELREFLSIPFTARLGDQAEWQEQIDILIQGPIFVVDQRFASAR